MMLSSPSRERRGRSRRTNPSENVSKLDVVVAEYEILWSRQARKKLDRLPQKIAERVYAVVDRFKNVPRPPISLKLRGGTAIWSYRILYAIDDGVRRVSILAVQRRKDVYRDL
jgi:mRNA-degrading endonuclease RelE of RelBE toxin-antitoxin system